MAKIFDEILLKGIRSGKVPAREEEARNWYRETAKKYTTINEKSLMTGDVDRLKTRPVIGSMYMLYYDAKHKGTLPYFDRFPLIFPFRKTEDGFIGINLHYLPHKYRAVLMDALYETANNKKFDETTKLKISYDILKNASQYSYFKPCVKRYLTAHVRSKLLYINPSEWDIALFLPTERFDGASKTKVWADSKKIIKGKK